MRLRVPSHARSRQAALLLVVLLIAAVNPRAATALPHRLVSPAATTHRILFDDSQPQQTGNPH